MASESTKDAPRAARGNAILGVALLLLAAASAVYVVRDFGSSQHDATHKPVPPGAKLVVYFFDQGKDCATCEQIPAYTLETLNTNFAGDRAAGTIVWREVDVDLAANEHFIDEFGLYTKSVVLVRLHEGAQLSWKNLTSVWDLLNDKPAFMDYLRGEISTMLAEPDL